MRSGNLDREITIQSSTTAIGADGTPIVTWATLATLRARRIEATTDEYIRGYGASTERIMVFRTRFVDGVIGADQILFEGQPFVIKQIKELGRRQALEFRAERIGP
jgi:SPP1 family predicted phage head-tail adaptor